MSGPSKIKRGAVLGFISSDPKHLKTNKVESILLYSIVTFGEFTLQLSTGELEFLHNGLSVVLSGDVVPENLFISPAHSWHTIKRLAGNDEAISLRYAAASWRLTWREAEIITQDIQAVLTDISSGKPPTG